MYEWLTSRIEYLIITGLVLTLLLQVFGVLSALSKLSLPGFIRETLSHKGSGLRATFLTRLVVEQLDDTSWKLLRELVCEFDPPLEDKLQYIKVPAEYVTDFASVPRLPFIYPYVGGLGKRAGVVHDYLYSTQMVSKQTADKALAACLAANGVSPLRRFFMHSGVRIAGANRYHHWRAPKIMETIATEVPIDVNPGAKAKAVEIERERSA